MNSLKDRRTNRRGRSWPLIVRDGYGNGKPFSIYHFPFFIFHLKRYQTSGVSSSSTKSDQLANEKWKMINGKWLFGAVAFIRTNPARLPAVSSSAGESKATDQDKAARTFPRRRSTIEPIPAPLPL